MSDDYTGFEFEVSGPVQAWAIREHDALESIRRASSEEDDSTEQDEYDIPTVDMYTFYGSTGFVSTTDKLRVFAYDDKLWALSCDVFAFLGQSSGGSRLNKIPESHIMRVRPMPTTTDDDSEVQVGVLNRAADWYKSLDYSGIVIYLETRTSYPKRGKLLLDVLCKNIGGYYSDNVEPIGFFEKRNAKLKLAGSKSRQDKLQDLLAESSDSDPEFTTAEDNSKSKANSSITNQEAVQPKSSSDYDYSSYAVNTLEAVSAPDYTPLLEEMIAVQKSTYMEAVNNNAKIAKSIAEISKNMESVSINMAKMLELIEPIKSSMDKLFNSPIIGKDNDTSKGGIVLCKVLPTFAPISNIVSAGEGLSVADGTITSVNGGSQCCNGEPCDKGEACCKNTQALNLGAQLEDEIEQVDSTNNPPITLKRIDITYDPSSVSVVTTKSPTSPEKTPVLVVDQSLPPVLIPQFQVLDSDTSPISVVTVGAAIDQNPVYVANSGELLTNIPLTATWESHRMLLNSAIADSVNQNHPVVAQTVTHDNGSELCDKVTIVP